MNILRKMCYSKRQVSTYNNPGVFHMTTKTAAISAAKATKTNEKRMTQTMTAIAWVVLGIGVLLCLTNITDFNDRNTGLMIGIGFLIASVNIYVIGTAISLVHARKDVSETNNP